jgi:hypothetical protein
MIRADVASPSVYVLGRLRTLPRRADPPIAFRLVFSRRRLRGSISSSAVNSIAAAFQQQEGYYPGSLAYLNNNPGNLVYAGQPGASPGAGGFAYFPSYAAGYQALTNQITLDATRGTDINGNPITTLSQLISSWAPPSQNPTATYISNVSAATGFDPNAPLSSLGTATGSSALDVSPDSTSDDSSFLDASVDLSSIGGPSAVSTPLVIGAGLLAVLVLSSLFR